MHTQTDVILLAVVQTLADSTALCCLLDITPQVLMNENKNSMSNRHFIVT